MGASKNVVIGLNLQWAYLNSKGSAYLGDTAVVLKERLKAWFSSLDKESSLVFLTKDVRAVDDDFFRSQPSRCSVGSDDIRLCSFSHSLGGHLIQTTRPSAVHKTPLIGLMSKNHINKVFLVGVETHLSVLYTAYDLRCLGYDVVVMEPLVASSDEYMHTAAISMMANDLGVDIVGG